MQTTNYLKILIITFFFLPVITISQGVAINDNDSEVDPSAMLDINSSDKGLLIPRMAQSEIQAIDNPANGLLVFSTSDDKLYTFLSSEGEWKEIAFGSGIITPPFSCGNSFTDTRDGKSYTTVEIGTQCWMQENLNIGTMINGSSSQANNTIIEKFCYGNDITNCDTYGGLYQWNEIMGYTSTPGIQGICPSGWQLPTDNDYCLLSTYLDNTVNCSSTVFNGTDAGGKMKTSGTSFWNSPNVGATNTSGFSSLPSGYRNTNINDLFRAIGDFNFLWTSSNNGSSSWAWVLLNSETRISRYSYSNQFGFSVRCIKD